MTRLRHTILLALFMVSPLACQDGTAVDAGSDSPAASESTSEGSQSKQVTVSSYLNHSSRFSLYLGNPTTKDVALSAASFKSGTNSENSLRLAGWKLNSQDRIDAGTFSGAILPAGSTMTFFMQFTPSSDNDNAGIFEVFYENAGASGTVEYEINGTLLAGLPPTPPPSNGTTSGGTSGGGTTGGGTTTGGTTTGGGTTSGTTTSGTSGGDVTAKDLNGEKQFKVTELLSYLVATGTEMALPGAPNAYVNVVFEPSVFTMKEITASNNFKIETSPPEEGGQFSGQPFIVTTNGDATGKFDPAVPEITVDDVELILHAENVTNATTGSETKEVELKFIVDLTSDKTETLTVKGKPLTAAQITAMETTFNSGSDPHFSDNQELLGIYPTPENGYSLALVGYSEIKSEDIIGGDGLLAFFANDVPIYVVIKGKVLEKP